MTYKGYKCVQWDVKPYSVSQTQSDFLMNVDYSTHDGNNCDVHILFCDVIINMLSLAAKTCAPEKVFSSNFGISWFNMQG